jgi:hypothetical protein
MEAIKGGQKSIDSLFVRPRQWQLTAFRKNEIVSDWIGERSQSSKFAGGAIWCHLASPKHWVATRTAVGKRSLERDLELSHICGAK